MSSYIDKLIKARKVYEMNDQRTIITDRMGSLEEQCITLTWEGESYENNTRDTISVTPDEVEKLFKKGLVTNVVRGENGKLEEKMCYADICQYDGAIVCGILAPSTKATLRQEIIDYAKKWDMSLIE